MALLITFFVLLLSMSSMEQAKLSAAAASMRGALGILTSTVGTTPMPSKITTTAKSDGDLTQQIQQQIQEIGDTLAKSNLSDLMDIDMTKDVLRINISDAYLFDSGRADIKPSADAILFQIAQILSWVPFDIQIEGHTDSDPISSARFPSNYELSYARALAIGERFISRGYREQGIDIMENRLKLIGYGDTRPKADNSTRQGKSINRRVEIEVNLKDDIRKSLVQGE
jgi:chemotaxis protein MotB